LGLKIETYKNMNNYTKQIKDAEVELRRKAKSFKKKRVTRLTRIETVKYDLLGHYAKENKISKSKMLDKIMYFYEINKKK
jgi:hypothetical protein